jgi:hypothetical protein
MRCRIRFVARPSTFPAPFCVDVIGGAVAGWFVLPRGWHCREPSNGVTGRIASGGYSRARLVYVIAPCRVLVSLGKAGFRALPRVSDGCLPSLYPSLP